MSFSRYGTPNLLSEALLNLMMRHLHLQFEFLIFDADVEKTEEKLSHGYQHQYMVETG